MLLTLLISFSVAFAFSHLILSAEPVRSKLIEAMGPLKFRLVYSFISVGTFAPAAVIVFTNPPLGPVLYDLPRWLKLVSVLGLTFVAFELIILSLATPSPVGLIPARPEARGVLRITRHPMNMGWTAFGLAHLIAGGSLGSTVFFGLCFVLVGLVGAYHQDRRARREATEEMTAFFRETSVFPFGAFVARRQPLIPPDLPWPMMVLAAVAWAAALYVHAGVLGVSPF